MIDMHNHVLFGVDDGAQNLEDSLAMLRRAVEVGFSEAVLTPHYMIYKGYTACVDENRARFDKLVEEANLEGIPITLHLGSELCYDYELINRLETGAYSTLDGTRYFLVETTRQGGTALGIQNFMHRLHNKGYKTLFAHPERYDFVQEDPNILLEFMERGTLIQSNYLSLLGYYDCASRDTMKILLEQNMVQLLGSDAHQTEGYDLYPQAEAAGIAIVGEAKWRELTCDNPRRLLSGEGTIAVDPEPYKKSIPRAAVKSVIGRFVL